MQMRPSKTSLTLIAIPLFLASCVNRHPDGIGTDRAAAADLTTNDRTAESGMRITDIQMAHGMDDRFMPVLTTKDFPGGTNKVVCWFKWSGAEIGSDVSVKWVYVTRNILVTTAHFSIPRKEGGGGVSLIMPAGKVLPAGHYEARLTLDGRSLSSVPFEVLGAS